MEEDKEVEEDRLKASQTKRSSRNEGFFWDSSNLRNRIHLRKESLVIKTNSTSKARRLRIYHRAKWVLHLAKPWVAPKQSKWFQNKLWPVLPKWVNLTREWRLLSKTSKLTKFLNSWWTLLLLSWARSRCQRILRMDNRTSLITRWKTNACEPRKISWILISKQ